MGDDVIGFDFSDIGMAICPSPTGYFRGNCGHIATTDNKYRSWWRSSKDGKPAQKRRSGHVVAC